MRVEGMDGHISEDWDSVKGSELYYAIDTQGDGS